MKLRTDPGNYCSLKILIAAGVNDVKIELENVLESTACRDRLPLLIVDDQLSISSSNVAVKYIFQQFGKEDKNLKKVEELIEWDITQLQPVLLPYIHRSIASGKQDDEYSTNIQQCLSHLDNLLADKKYFLSDSISSIDVIIWAALYPVFEQGPCHLALPNLVNLHRFYQSLVKESAFQAAVLTVTNGQGVNAFKDSLSNISLPQIDGLNLTDDAKPQKKQSTSNSSNLPDPVAGDGESVLVSDEELVLSKQAWSSGREDLPPPREQIHPKEPRSDDRNILVTSALPYVNNVPHLGNIIGCVLSGDVFTRYCRLCNYNCLHVCGTDEYGTATETKALAEGLTPAEICTKYNKIHSEVYQWFNIDFDYFGRTTTEAQTKISQDIFWKLYNNGYILKDSVEQLKCEKCDRFLADRFVEGTCPLCKYEDARGDQCDGCGKLLNATDLLVPRCKLCSETPTTKSSNHLFLDLPQLTDKLSAFLETRFTEDSLWSSNAKLITKSWMRDGLKPRCITRDLKWGTPVPLEGYTDKVFYVWFDAPIGYLSIGANYSDNWEKWFKNPDMVEYYQFVGKDNVPFHSVIYPATLLGTGEKYTMVSQLSATEYLNYEETKFSKSRGTGVFGNDASDTGIPADIWRFYLLFVRPESQDSNFSWDDFMLKNNTELLNNLGNFVNRALMFVFNNFSATIPEITLTDDDYEILALINREIKAYIHDMEHLNLRDGIRKILNISRLGNQFMQANKPWVLVKGDECEKQRAGTVVGLLANISCLISVLLQPYMPHVSATIQTQLNAPASCNVIGEMLVQHLPPGHKIGKPSPLFQKLETKLINELKKKYAGQQQPPKQKAKDRPKETGGDIATDVNVDELNAAIAAQGDVVRELKTAKAEKDVISKEVEKLLALKKQLAAATGQESEPAKKKGKNKKK